MLIEHVSVTPLAVPLSTAYRWRYGSDEFAYLILFTVEGANGLCGYGESVCIQPEATEAYGCSLARFFVGRQTHELNRIRHEIWHSGRWSVTPRLTNLALAGLDVACWDLW